MSFERKLEIELGYRAMVMESTQRVLISRRKISKIWNIWETGTGENSRLFGDGSEGRID